jgi:hypothetical protein
MKFFDSTDLDGRTVRRQLSYAGIFLILIFVFSGNPACAEEIRSFTADLTVNHDGNLRVKEDIVVDFGNFVRHGLRRFIPITYNRGAGTYTLRLDVAGVTDDSNNPLTYRVDNTGPDVSLRIGDPYKIVTGVQSYSITYDVRKAINFFGSGPELYWNVNGTRWPWAIDKCVARFHPPFGVTPSQIHIAAYQGVMHSTVHARIVSQDSKGIVIEADHLKPGENLTVVYGLPEGSIKRPSLLDDVFIFIGDWLGLFLWPALTGIVLYLFWSFYGRDEKRVASIGVEWTPPPDLTPAEVGTLVDESVDTPDILSTLVDLASRGYLKIKTIPFDRGFFNLSQKDYQFTKTEPPKPEPKLKPHEQLFLDAVFPTLTNVSTLSDLKGKFALDIPYIRNAIWDSLLTKGMFTRDPETDVATFSAVGVAAIVFGIVLLFISTPGGHATAFGVIISGAMIAFSGKAMPQKTAAGSIAYARCKAFQRFVQTAEKQRIALLAKDDPTIFGRLLPYAMVLGAADKWADAFKDLMIKPPDWYDNSAFSTNTVFSPDIFVYDLGDSMHSISSGFTAAPIGYSGGGDSGGGFGGGSWTTGGGGGFSGFSGGSSGGGFGGGGGGSW